MAVQVYSGSDPHLQALHASMARVDGDVQGAHGHRPAGHAAPSAADAGRIGQLRDALNAALARKP
jgi:hypothetical protein